MKKSAVISVIAILSGMTSFANATLTLNKWKIGNNVVNSSTFELQASQSAIYDDEINVGSFKNFVFTASITHSEGAKASFWIHSDANLAKGYSILIGQPADDRRRSGSLATTKFPYSGLSCASSQRDEYGSVT